MNKEDREILVNVVHHYIDVSDEEDVKKLLQLSAGPIICAAIDDFIEAGVLEKKW